VVLPDPTTVSGPTGVRLVIPTPQEADGQATHPSVVYIPETIGGFAYWMGMTPYQDGNDAYEDPCVLCSTDGIAWQVPPGLVNPIDDQPGGTIYNSDTDLRYVDGTLHLFWRTLDTSGASPGSEEKIYWSTSVDGATWAAKTLIYSSDQTVRRLVSPSFVYEGGAWTMWAVDVLPSPNQVVRLQGSATPAGAWAAPEGVDMGVLPETKEPWHLYVGKQDDGYVALLNDCTLDVSGRDGLLYFCTSTDGIVFANSGQTVIPQVVPGEYDQLYRSCLLPDTEGGVSGWRVWYAGWRIDAQPVWHLYRTFIAAPVVIGPIDPPAPPVGEAVEAPVVEWMVCDVTTGNKVAYLPGVRGTISRALGAYTADTFTVPAPLTGPLALGNLLYEGIGPAQLPTRMLVCIVNGLPQWGGIIWKVRGGTGATIELTCATPESYLDRRYVGDRTFTQTDQATIAGTLVQDTNVEGISLQIDAPLSGTLRDRQYRDDENATVYKRLQELMDVDGGPEWTIDLDWKSATQQAVRLIFRVRDRVGSSVPRGPLATQSKAVVRYDVTYDYGAGMGANDILAYSSGEGTVRPQSQHIRNTIALAAGVPRIEHRWMPSSSIKDTTTLNAHATSALYRLDGGTTSLAVTSRWNIAPARLGIDLQLGDDIEYALTGHMHPNGLTGTARMIGYRLDPAAATFEPVLRM